MEFKHAIVTGAASGMGAIEVRNLRRRGVRVTALDLSPELKGVYADDLDVVCEVGDVTDLEWCRSIAAAADAREPVDLLFHAAGIMPGGDLAEMGAERIRKLMDVNYGGTVNMVDSVVSTMLDRGAGQIVLFGSVAGIVPNRKFGGYGASKAAINFYAEVLHHEVRGRGLKVLLVTPSAVATPLLQQATEGPKVVNNLPVAVRKVMIADPEKVVRSVDQAIRRRRWVVRPGARALTGLRRLSPRLTWAAVEGAEKLV